MMFTKALSVGVDLSDCCMVMTMRIMVEMDRLKHGEIKVVRPAKTGFGRQRVKRQ